MYRRELIATTTVALGGCLGSASSPGSDVENRTRTGGVESETAPAASTTLAYGDWYEAESVNVTVTDISTRRTLETASTPDDAIPPDTQLAILSGEIENTTGSRLDLGGIVNISLAVVASDQLFRPVTTPSSDDEQGSVDVNRIEGRSGTHLTSGEIQLSPEERVSVWQAVLVPSGISTDEVQITMCGRDGGCAVRWEPASKSCDCPG
ncbi:hypothetical protein [Halolamina salifodinae]|uniref:Lipoprotein n=1 Tax=Halolamina salifodinae TaxID=1202767 RepID=A0A8T4GUX6_9EURY|nr:hypothetical protein [Halolamina salifodinae]MBP1986837.1 hypothetical protein [Halolamina salifodinae]